MDSNPRSPSLTAKTAAAALAAAVVLTATTASAQVNAEVLRPDPLRAGWSGGLDGSLSLYRGNIELLDLGGAARVQLQTLHPQEREPRGDRLPFVAQRGFITASARFAARSGTSFVNQGFVHARWTAMWHPRIGSDLFAQYQSNEFLRLRARAVAGSGVRVEIVHHRIFMAWAGSGYMFEYNRIDVSPGAPDAPTSLEHRWTNYATARLAVFDSRLLLQNTVYYQPRFDFHDYRLLEELEVLARVTTVFGLGVTFSVLHDSAPPTGVKATDLRLASMVRLSF